MCSILIFTAVNIQVSFKCMYYPTQLDLPCIVEFFGPAPFSIFLYQDTWKAQPFATLV